MHIEDHVTSAIANIGIGVQGGIIEQPDDFVLCGSGGFGLLGGNGDEEKEHGQVNDNGVVEKGSNDFLEKGDQLGKDHGGRIRGFGVLDGSVIVGSLP